MRLEIQVLLRRLDTSHLWIGRMGIRAFILTRQSGINGTGGGEKPLF